MNYLTEMMHWVPSQRLKQAQGEAHRGDFRTVGHGHDPAKLQRETVSRTTDQEAETASDFSTTVGATGSQIVFKLVGEMKTFTCGISQETYLFFALSQVATKQGTKSRERQG